MAKPVLSPGCALDLAGLLAAPDGDFFHDVMGINRYLDRSTGGLTQCFVPRYAAKYLGVSK